MQNFFAIFGFEPKFTLDLNTLESAYRAVQSASHPDRFVTAAAAEKLAAMQTATTANEAYNTLKHPAQRAAHLLALQNIDVLRETNTQMPADFLMQQMEWREALEDAKQVQNIDALEALLSEMRNEARGLQMVLGHLFDQKNDLASAAETTRKLIFIDKVCADIYRAIEQLDS